MSVCIFKENKFYRKIIIQGFVHTIDIVDSRKDVSYFLQISKLPLSLYRLVFFFLCQTCSQLYKIEFQLLKFQVSAKTDHDI